MSARLPHRAVTCYLAVHASHGYALQHMHYNTVMVTYKLWSCQKRDVAVCETETKIAIVTQQFTCTIHSSSLLAVHSVKCTG